MKQCLLTLQGLYGGNKDSKPLVMYVDEDSDDDEYHGSDDDMEEQPMSAWCPIALSDKLLRGFVRQGAH